MTKRLQPPQRTCIACRHCGDQAGFFRVSQDAGGRVVMWKDGCVGRSAYICHKEECLEEAFKKGRIERALRRKLDQQQLEALKEELICKLR